MKRRIVRGVDLVASVDVSGAEEGVRPVSEVFALVGRGVRPEQRGVVDVVGVGGGSAGMIGRDSEVVEALLGGNDGIFGVVNGEIVGQGGEVFLDLGTNDANGVIGTGVQSLAHQGGDVGWDVVGGMV